MARKNAPAQAAEDPTSTEVLEARNTASQEQAARSMAIAQRFGDGAPYERERVVSQARFFMATSAEAMLEAGKCLIQLKENEPHGEFLEIIEERLAISKRTAQVMMQAAARYLAPALQSKAQAPALLSLGKTKLIDLLAEPDDAVAALADGGTVAGMDLEDIQAMSSRELRAALKEARRDLTAKDKVIDKKNAKIDAAAEAEEKRLNGSMDEREQAQLDELRTASTKCEAALLALVASVDAATANAATEAAELCARQSLEYVVQRLADACAARGIAVDVLGEAVAPGWKRAIDAAVEQGSKRGRKH